MTGAGEAAGRESLASELALGGEGGASARAARLRIAAREFGRPEFAGAVEGALLEAGGGLALELLEVGAVVLDLHESLMLRLAGDHEEEHQARHCTPRHFDVNERFLGRLGDI